jgi:hypothetical protein
LAVAIVVTERLSGIIRDIVARIARIASSFHLIPIDLNLVASAARRRNAAHIIALERRTPAALVAAAALAG